MALVIFCFIGYKYQLEYKNYFPEDLMYNGLPINPSCVVSTQCGDSSRLKKPQHITYTAAIMLQNYGYKVHSDVCTFNPMTKTVTARCEYSREEECRWPDHYQEEYRYIGSYKNKHIVITRHHDSSGSGRFSELGLITRNGDTVCNAGEITAGDRAHGGVIDVISFKDNILRFKQIAPLAEINNIVPHDSDCSLPESPFSEGLWFVYEVDLDNAQLTPLFCGISFFDKENYQDCCASGKGEKCFYRLAGQSIERGKQTLNSEESKAFVHSVWSAIAGLDEDTDNVDTAL